MKNIFGIFLIISFLAAEVLAEEVEVDQFNKGFNKTTVTLKKGDKIKFVNSEDKPGGQNLTHNVYSLGPKNAFELKTQKPGESSTVEFKEAGETDVECAIHTNMKLKVKVTE